MSSHDDGIEVEFNEVRVCHQKVTDRADKRRDIPRLNRRFAPDPGEKPGRSRALNEGDGCRFIQGSWSKAHLPDRFNEDSASTIARG